MKGVMYMLNVFSVVFDFMLNDFPQIRFLTCDNFFVALEESFLSSPWV